MAAKLNPLRCLLVFLVCLGVAGCAPAFFTYRYIGLKDDLGAEILEYGKSDVPNLFFHRTMPIRYKLARNSYILEFEIDKKNYSPNMTVKVESNNISTLRILRNDDARETICANYYYLNRVSRRILPHRPLDRDQPYWLVYTVFGCRPGTLPQPEAIQFVIVDEEDSVVATESIPFEIISNGFFMMFDAI